MPARLTLQTAPATMRHAELRNTRSVLGTSLLVTNYSNLTFSLQRLIQHRPPVAVDFTNTQIIALRRHDREFRQLTNGFDYFVPDGMPLVWCLNAQRAGLRDRVYGPTFMKYCVCHSPAPFSHYFLGGSEHCLERLKSSFLNTNPSIRIAGCHHGYFTPDQESQVIKDINRASPDFLWIGLGTPKQQAWIHKYKSQISRGVLLTVGFAFDVNAGTKPDAPTWMQRRGLTWIFRLLSEPRRLGPRYVRYNSLFLSYLLWDGIRGRAWQISE